MRTVSAILQAHGGVASWSQLTDQVAPHLVKYAARSGRIVRLLPRVYALADPSPEIGVRAALLFAGAGSCLSHTSALACWPRIHVPPDPLVHVLVPADRHRRSTGFAQVHRYPRRPIPRELIVERRGLRVLRPADALLGAWSVLPPDRRRAPVIDAVRIGLVAADQLSAAAAARPRLRGRAELRQLIDLLRAGCQSELELMGFRSVFSDRRLPAAAMQFNVIIDARRYVLDVAWPALLIAVELDGAAYHGSADARERDVRRDSALARAGWLTVRITYERLVHDPAAIIEELLGIIAVRQRQLGVAG